MCSAGTAGKYTPTGSAVAAAPEWQPGIIESCRNLHALPLPSYALGSLEPERKKRHWGEGAVNNVTSFPSKTRPAAHPETDQQGITRIHLFGEMRVIGPAGQMTADERGVVMIDRNDELQIAKRTALSSSPGRGTGGCRISQS